MPHLIKKKEEKREKASKSKVNQRIWSDLEFKEDMI